MATLTEPGALRAFSSQAPSAGSELPDDSWDGAAVHCGNPMELVTPAVGPAAVVYTFEPEDGGPAQLPPVWRCGCGFQLDAWFYSPFASRGKVYGSGAFDAAALSA